MAVRDDISVTSRVAAAAVAGETVGGGENAEMAQDEKQLGQVLPRRKGDIHK